MTIEGKEVLKIRDGFALTKEQFGQKLGDFTRGDVAAWESGTNKVPDEVAAKMKALK